MSAQTSTGTPAVVDVATAARRLGISRGHAYSLIRSGEFPVRHIRMGNRIVIPTAALEELLGGAA